MLSRSAGNGYEKEMLFMSFLDTLKKTAGAAAQVAAVTADTAVNKTKTMASIGRVKLAISSEEDKLKKAYTELGYAGLPICMAKTQYSLSDDQTKLGRPEGFTINVSKVKISAGAGFVVVQTGDIMTMPGLPKVPAAEKIDVDENGVITGLF